MTGMRRASAMVLLAIIAGYVGLSAWSLAESSGASYLGIEVATGGQGVAVIGRVFPGGAAWEMDARPGDILASLDGRAATEEAWLASEGRASRFSYVPAGSQVPVNALIGHARTYSGVLRWVLAFNGLVFLLVGCLVSYRTRRTAQATALSLLLVSAATALAVAPAGSRWSPFSIVLSSTVIPWVAAWFAVFFATFPDGARKPRATVAAPWLLLLAVPVVDGFLLVAFFHAPSLYPLARTVAFVEITLGLAAGLAHLLHSYLAAHGAAAREQVRVVLFGTAGGIGPFLAFGVAPQAFGFGPLMRPEATALTTVVFPLSLAFAVMRHQLLGIRQLVHRGAAYLMASLVAYAAYAGLVALLGRGGTLGGESGSVFQIALLALFFGGISLSGRVRRLALTAADRLLFRGTVDLRAIREAVTLEASGAPDLVALTRVLTTQLARSLDLSYGVVLTEKGGCVQHLAAVGAVPSQVSGMVTALRESRGASGGRVITTTTPGGEDQVLLARLWLDDGEEAVLCLGSKVSGEWFTEEEADLVRVLSGHIGAAADRLRLLKALQSKSSELRELNRRLVDAQEEERSSIATYLHDEPLQRVTQLMWESANEHVAGQLVQGLKEVAAQLRDFTTRLHPAVLQDLGLVRALEWLATESSDAAMNVGVEVDGVGRDERLGRDVELAIYRIAQEALTNCRRHASASQVAVTLWRRGDSVLLAVEDDGMGIGAVQPAPDRRTLGIAGMRERAEQLGGTLAVGAGEMGGTLVSARVRISREPAAGRLLRELAAREAVTNVGGAEL